MTDIAYIVFSISHAAEGKKTTTTLFGHTVPCIKEMCINIGGRKERRDKEKKKGIKRNL